MSSPREHAAPMVISSTIPGLREMSILTVGEILAMLPSSKASGAGIGLLNQSICPGGMKSLVLITHIWELGQEGERSSVKEKVLYDGAHSMGNQGWLIPPRYLCHSGK
jgi:hypothetical protein